MIGNCVVGNTKTGVVRLIPRRLFDLLKTTDTANLTPNYVGKTFKGGPLIDRLRTPIRQTLCPECNDPDTLYLGQRLTDCNVCGGSGIALRFV